MAKTVFRSRLTSLSSAANCSGSRYRTDFSESLDDRGVSCIKKSGQTDMQDYINSFFSDVDIYSILSRILCNSSNSQDVSGILDDYLRSVGQSGIGAQYMDISDMPKTIHDVKNGFVEMTNIFNRLPSDVKLEYHNSVDEFVFGFNDFIKKYSAQPLQAADPVNEPVKEVSDNG